MIYSCIYYFIEAVLHDKAMANEMDADGFKKKSREREMKGEERLAIRTD